jgi:hypothetical protein
MPSTGVLTTQELAAQLGVSPATVREWADEAIRLHSEPHRMPNRGERLHASLNRLHAAIALAAQAGDQVAQGCLAESVETLLDRLTRHFENCIQPDQEADQRSR